MELSLDIERNRLLINGQAVPGTRRWEVAALALLASSDGPGGVGAAELNGHLSRRGQLRPLQRTQIKRLWESVRSLFDHAGRVADFDSRFGVAPRKLTVGPWRWQLQAGDRVSVIGEAAPSPQPAPPAELPALATQLDPLQSARLCLTLLTAQSLYREGELRSNLDLLADDRAWTGASHELEAWRSARLAETAWLLRDFSLAEHAMRTAEARCAQSHAARTWIGPQVALLAPRMAYARDPAGNWRSVQRALEDRLTGAPGTDRLHGGLVLNHLALCARREMEQLAQEAGPPGAARAALQRAIQTAEAAVWCFAVAETAAYAQAASANLGHALARARTLELLPDAKPAFAWFGVAQSWMYRFHLPEDSVWDYVFIGDLYLYGSQPGEFEARGTQQGWDSLRPDEMAFYLAALRRAREIADPRQIAHCLLNHWQFSRRCGQLGVDSRQALALLLAEHPDLRGSLQREGYPLPRANARPPKKDTL